METAASSEIFFFFFGGGSCIVTHVLCIIAVSLCFLTRRRTRRREKNPKHVSERHATHTHTHLTKAQTHGFCKCRHTKPFLLNTSNAVNPFNRFSVAMATRCRLTEQDVTKKKKPFFLGDRWRHPETSDGSGACVCICVQKVNELMCLCANVLSISSLPPMMKRAVSEGWDCSFVTDITLCSVKNN